MPKTKKSGRSYEAQASSPLDGLRLAPQRAARPNPVENDHAAREEGRSPAKRVSLEPELIRKLIAFFESI